MQYIPNMLFWLQSAFAAVTQSVAVALAVLLFCLFGIGLGLGLMWNKKWRFGLDGFVISALFGVLCAALGMVYVGMGVINDTVLNKTAKNVVLEDCCRDLADNSRLIEAAYKEGIKNIKNSGVDGDSLDEDTLKFDFPGESDEACKTNKEQFIAGVAKVIAKGEPMKKGAKIKVTSLSDMKPFCYGYAPVSSDNKDGALFAALEENLCDRDVQTISIEDPFWYNVLCRAMVEKSLKNLSTTVCNELDAQRNSVLFLIIMLMLLQAGLISWLSLSDIKIVMHEPLPEVQ